VFFPQRTQERSALTCSVVCDTRRSCRNTTKSFFPVVCGMWASASTLYVFLEKKKKLWTRWFHINIMLEKKGLKLQTSLVMWSKSIF
jgi:hypothetical protein